MSDGSPNETLKESLNIMLGSASRDESMESVMVESTVGPAIENKKGNRKRAKRNVILHLTCSQSLKHTVCIHCHVVTISVQSRYSSGTPHNTLVVGHVTIHY